MSRPTLLASGLLTATLLECMQSRTQSPLAFWSADGRQQRLWGIRKNLIFLIGCPATTSIVLPQESGGNKIPVPQSLYWRPNLVPRVSPLHAPGSERGETLVGAGHVSPKIWEITNNWREGRLSVSLPILSVLRWDAHTKMGKHAPVRINLQNRACFKGHVKWSSRNP